VINLIGELLSFLRRGDNIFEGTIVIPQGELTTFPMELLSFLEKLLPFPREHITWKVEHCSSCMKINFNISFILLEFPIREHAYYHIACDTQMEIKCSDLNPNVINP
jgi:hypothetical protein